MTAPSSAEDFTLAWLNEALAPHLSGARVTDVRARESDTPGQTAEIIKLELDYSEDVALPRRMVAKITSRNPAVIALVSVYGQYARETAFYNEIPDVGLAVPACYHAGHEPEAQTLVILMEDLHPGENPSWAATTDQVETALAALPAFHARWWNDRELLAKPWIVQLTDTAFYGAGAGAAVAGIEAVTTHFGDSAAYTYELIRTWQARLPRILEFAQSRPHTFVHGDYHPKQMFFPTTEGGKFAVIDWQFPFIGQGTWDVMRLMGVSLPFDYRRAHHQRLLDEYHAGLLQHGVTGYSRKDLDQDAHIGAALSQLIMMVAIADTDVEIVKRECETLGIDWKDLFLLRTNAMLQDMGTLEFLREL